MKDRNSRNRRILLLLIFILLISISYLALEFSIYVDGRWQIVQGQEIGVKTNKDIETLKIELPKKIDYGNDYWNVLREGRLFFKSLPEKRTVPTNPQPKDQPVTPVTLIKPVCPWVAVGVLLGEEPTAILAHKQNQTSQTVKVGDKLGEYEVMQIEKDFVLLKSPDGEFKLELGGF
ncbi:hypothetical protein BBF96_03730 [Anoxybacter fermentans]|uniref:Type II secretion system protein GspC N-terminal domain-containing protein n=1 Tax=Anoxybacter fermentans TaxID=1323375 RepID=A0A3S9SWE2_9FIRM|nr:hypothetical protein [Anoxybacter fermentans]AZR72572.1 hypothetical protein BBF96_03730 [Anoxybacter fermentans]